MNSTPNEETSTAISQGPGQRLRQARENINMPLDEVAKKLRLSRVQVVAIEKDDYSYVTALAYAKGHLRMYASLVGLPSYEILKAFDALGLQGDTAAIPRVLRTQSIINEREKKSAPGSLRLVLVVTSMVVLIAGLYIWQMGRRHHELTSASAPASSALAPVAAQTTTAVVQTPSAQAAATTPVPITSLPNSAGDQVVPLTLPPDNNSAVKSAEDTKKLNAEMPIHRARPVDQNTRAPEGSDNVRE